MKNKISIIILFVTVMSLSLGSQVINENLKNDYKENTYMQANLKEKSQFSESELKTNKKFLDWVVKHLSNSTMKVRNYSEYMKSKQIEISYDPLHLNIRENYEFKYYHLSKSDSITYIITDLIEINEIPSDGSIVRYSKSINFSPNYIIKRLIYDSYSTIEKFSIRNLDTLVYYNFFRGRVSSSRNIIRKKDSIFCFNVSFRRTNDSLYKDTSSVIDTIYNTEVDLYDLPN